MKEQTYTSHWWEKEIPEETMSKWKEEEKEFPGILMQKIRFYKDFSEREMVVFSIGYKLGQEELQKKSHE